MVETYTVTGNSRLMKALACILLGFLFAAIFIGGVVTLYGLVANHRDHTRR